MIVKLFFTILSAQTSAWTAWSSKVLSWPFCVPSLSVFCTKVTQTLQGKSGSKFYIFRPLFLNQLTCDVLKANMILAASAPPSPPSRYCLRTVAYLLILFLSPVPCKPGCGEHVLDWLKSREKTMRRKKRGGVFSQLKDMSMWTWGQECTYNTHVLGSGMNSWFLDWAKKKGNSRSQHMPACLCVHCICIA